MIYLFAVRLNWFPAFGATSAGRAISCARSVRTTWSCRASPWGSILRRRSPATPGPACWRCCTADYIRTARAKGLREWTVIVRHGLKNALIPIITVIAFRLPYLISGAVIIETVFQWPGLGCCSLNAATQKDYPLVMALD